jgi:hypothetical protein
MMTTRSRLQKDHNVDHAFAAQKDHNDDQASAVAERSH